MAAVDAADAADIPSAAPTGGIASDKATTPAIMPMVLATFDIYNPFILIGSPEF
ncbi:hypothetical protein [Parasphingorhabdus sp.]|uniref:hypothetical protein n=1 Tax=Parasphingorhabdus sp. TaxID=2709688 RepID=UPI00300313F2